MTREKRELLKQLRDLDEEEYFERRMDMSGDCGSMISNHFDELRQPIYNRLNALMHGHLSDYFLAIIPSSTKAEAIPF